MVGSLIGSAHLNLGLRYLYLKKIPEFALTANARSSPIPALICLAPWGEVAPKATERGTTPLSGRIISAPTLFCRKAAKAAPAPGWLLFPTSQISPLIAKSASGFCSSLRICSFFPKTQAFLGALSALRWRFPGALRASRRFKSLHLLVLPSFWS